MGIFANGIHAARHALGGPDAVSPSAIGAAVAMTTTAVKTGAYTATPFQIVPVDATGAPVTVTVPTAPPDGTRETVKKIDSSVNLVTVAAGGSDVFNVIGGTTTKTLTLSNQALTLQFSAGIWYLISDDLPLSQLDARFLSPAQGNSTYLSQGFGNAVPDPAGLFAPRSRPQPWVPASDLISQFEAGHGWAGSAGFVANDTADYITGVQSAKIATSGTGAFKIESPALALDMTGKQIRLRVKIDDISNVTYLNVTAGNDAAYVNSYKWFVQGTAGGSNALISGGAVAQEGWAVLVLNVTDAQPQGAPTRTGITRLKLEIARTAAAGEVTLHIDEIDLVPEPAGMFPNGAVVICFDDILNTSWGNAKLLLDQYRFRSSQFVIIDQVGVSGRTTLDQLHVMQDEGHEIHAHAFTDVDHGLTYTGMTGAQLDADLRAQKAWLRANGFRGDGTAYPLGQYGLTSDGVSTQSIVQRYFSFARTTANGTNKPGGTYPIGDPFRLPGASSISGYAGGFPPATLNGSGTGSLGAVAANHGVKIMTFHKVVTGAPAALTEISVADFGSILAQINALGMAVLTMDEFIATASTASAATSVSYSAAAPGADTTPGTAGSATTVARSDHTHHRYAASPVDRGWRGWTLDPEYAASTTVLATPGTLYVFRAKLPAGGPITNVVSQLTTLGVTLTTGQCFVGIATTAGALIASSADMAATWAAPGTTGVKSFALAGGPAAVAGGEVEIWVLFNGTTGPTFPRGNGNAIINSGFGQPKYATADTGITALPATRGALTALSVSYCFGLS